MKQPLIVSIILSLIFPVLLTACGGDDGGGNAATATPAASAVATAAVTATPAVNNDPVKIGAICPWSGPAAMSGLGIADPVIKLVEWQVKQQGGILGGRGVKVVKYDNRGVVSETQAGFRKLYYQEKVSAIVWGGVTQAEREAGAGMAEELKILLVPTGEVANLAELKFTVNSQPSNEEYPACGARLMTRLLKAKTVAFLGVDNADARDNLRLLKPHLEAAGIQIVYQAYVPVETSDYSSYLTKVKYEHPDVVYTYCASSEFYLSIAKQITELGGWGDIKLIAYPGAENAKKMAGAKGWYLLENWAPGMESPAATRFFADYQKVNGAPAVAAQIYFYNPLWTAIYAIELAGTDTDLVTIAQVARSGKLECDTPSGHARFMPDGTCGMMANIARIDDGGNLVYVPLPEN